MQDLKPDLTFVSGLENQQRRRELGDHAIGNGALLTARKPTANQPLTNMSVGAPSRWLFLRGNNSDIRQPAARDRLRAAH